jgi:hypothetical protein
MANCTVRNTTSKGVASSRIRFSSISAAIISLGIAWSFEYWILPKSHGFEVHYIFFACFAALSILFMWFQNRAKKMPPSVNGDLELTISYRNYFSAKSFSAHNPAKVFSCPFL